jgi:hypothetical protein
MNLTESQGRVWRRAAAWGAGGSLIVAVIVAAFAAWRLLDRDPEPTAPDQRPTPARPTSPRIEILGLARGATTMWFAHSIWA